MAHCSGVCAAPITAAPKGLARTLEVDIPVGASVDRMGGLPTFQRVPPPQEEIFNRAALSISAFSVGHPNVTALWRVLLLPWIGQ
jgi:hypothetical protein